jgi:hypothetical protein
MTREEVNLGSTFGALAKQANLRDRNLMMISVSPESIGKVHTIILEIEGILFNILLFCKFAVHEIKALTRRRRRVRHDGN